MAPARGVELQLGMTPFGDHWSGISPLRMVLKMNEMDGNTPDPGALETDAVSVAALMSVETMEVRHFLITDLAM